MRAEGLKERPTTHTRNSTMCSDAWSAKTAPYMAQVVQCYVTVYITPVALVGKCQPSSLPYMNLLRLVSEYIILGWTLLWAFGPHELLVITM